MTIIAAAHDGQRYAMAADSHEGAGSGWGMPTATKCSEAAGCLWGASGGYAAVQAGLRWLGDTMLPEDTATREGVEAWMLGLHEYLLDHSTAPQQQPNEPRLTGAWWLCVGPAGIATLDTAGAISWYEGFFALGSGEEFAMGAMHALSGIESPGAWYPIGIVQWGVAAACLYSTSCDGPVVSMTGEVDSKR